MMDLLVRIYCYSILIFIGYEAIKHRKAFKDIVKTVKECWDEPLFIRED